MASNPWAILGAARQGQSIGDIYLGAKQRRLADLYRAKQEERLDRKDKREQEEVDAYGDVFEIAAPKTSAQIRVGAMPLAKLSDVGTGLAPTSPLPAPPVGATQPDPGNAVPPPNGDGGDDQEIVVTGRKLEETPPRNTLVINVDGLRRLGRVNPKLGSGLID